jgi:hypothetical protein
VAIGDPGVIDVVDTKRMELIETVKTEPGRTRSVSTRRETRSMRFFPRRIGLRFFAIEADRAQWHTRGHGLIKEQNTCALLKYLQLAD